MVPTVTSTLRLNGRVHASEARLARAHTNRKLKFTLPGPMTIVDTIADAYYGDRVKMAMAVARLLNIEARALQADGIDLIAMEGLSCATAVHICYGYGIKANIDWKATLGQQWRQYQEIFPALARCRIDEVSIECRNSRVPLELLKLLEGKRVQIGAIDVATDAVETPEQVAATITEAAKYVPAENIVASTNCGMAPMQRDIAVAKLEALANGATLARKLFG
jgi:5-methyltetrahydropteroyltriglutamate--homocysteine methyltransferase